MTRDDWRELVYWMAVAGAILTTILLIYGVSGTVVQLLA